MRFLPFLFTLLLLSCSNQNSQKNAVIKTEGTAELVVLVSIDTWRYDAWGMAPSDKVKTPQLDSLARQGVIFDNAFAHNVVTLPSHANMLTALYPYEHGIRDNAGFRLDANVKTLAHHFKDAGFETAAFVSAFPLDSRYGLDAGFDLYDDFYQNTQNDELHVPERSGKQTIDAALSWMNQRKKPAFVWVHLYEPHFPYIPPEPYKSQYAEAPYYGEIAYVDELLAPLFDKIKASNDAVVAVTSDHGESLGEHGELTHGVFTYNATLKVPLFFWATKRMTHQRVDRLARHIDIMPSLLELNGLPIPKGISGQSLFSKEPTSETSYFESLSTFFNRGWAPLRGCVDQQYKAIDLPVVELYDLEKDPGELANLGKDDAERAALFLACLPDEVGLGSSRASLSDEEMEKLRALGYVSSTNTVVNEDEKGKDPKFLMDADRKLHRALALLQKNQPRKAIALFEEILTKESQMLVAYLHLSDAYERIGRIDLSIETMKNALDNGVRSETAVRKLALYLTGTGKADDAWLLLKSFQDSEDPETHRTFGKIHANLNQFPLAQAAFEKSLSFDRQNPQALADLGTLFLMKKELQTARDYFDQSLEQDDRLAEAWNGKGVVHAQMGQIQNAVDAWEQAIKYSPKMTFCYANLGTYYEKLGNYELALARWKTYAELTQGPARKRAMEKIEILQKSL